MRVLFVTHYFHPEVRAAPTRILELAQELSAHGHEVTVLTGFPNYPDRVIPLSCLRVVRAAVDPAPNRGVARRVLNHASFALSSVVASLGQDGPTPSSSRRRRSSRRSPGS